MLTVKCLGSSDSWPHGNIMGLTMPQLQWNKDSWIDEQLGEAKVLRSAERRTADLS